jgi:hypothetical protein
MNNNIYTLRKLKTVYSLKYGGSKNLTLPRSIPSGAPHMHSNNRPVLITTTSGGKPLLVADRIL